MSQDGSTALMLAAQYGSIAVVEYLVEGGADMEVNDNVSIGLCC